MDAVVAPLEFDVARERVAQRLPVGSSLRTDGWADVPLAIRERAFFSAGVESARALGELQGLVLGSASRGEFVARARGFLQAHGIARRPADAAENADLTNIGGTRRLELVYEHNLQAARGYGWWREGQDPDVLDAFPAQELLREEDRREPRDWAERWSAAGGKVFGGRMIALKSDPVWGRISRFGTPWPPFDFGSGMGVQDVEREEAEALGLIQPGAAVEGDERAFHDGVRASVRGIPRDAIEGLELAFGDQIRIDPRGGMAALKPQGSYQTWSDLGLPSARTWVPTTRMPARMSAAEGVAALRRGREVLAKDGTAVLLGPEVLAHWQGHPDAALRPAFLPVAVATLETPIEIWAQATQTVYIRAFARDGGGYRGCVVFADLAGGARTYFLKNISQLDAARRGLRML